jgi:hypothetical protein
MTVITPSCDFFHALGDDVPMLRRVGAYYSDLSDFFVVLHFGRQS